ncbi:probable phytol kinase 1, chloroplastic isoform X1 [Neltuma alba]|uniref:probable phytol kinase 1, chloroplastic isoform X1 n=2 Tax=Neltuma alba TaxID=207710 RepID=UPI0010A3CE82|nr:probable phytol kinase 1, chloroplastic isoform X1 [Prosopis alba]
MSLLSISSFPRFLAFSSGRRRESTSTTCLVPPLRWNRCLGLPQAGRVGFLGSATEPAVVRFIPRGLGAVAEDLLHDAGATVAVLVGGYALVFAFNDLTRREVLQQNLSRKLVHMLSGLLFVASWPIFSNSIGARYFAAFVPLVNCFRLVVNGLSLTSDEGLIKSVTREGQPRELLRGPLYYVLMLMLCSLIFWRNSPVGVVSLAMMCGGDGIADIIGRRFGSVKIPYNKNKSLAGSISMLAFGSFISIGMLYYYSVLGYMQLDWGRTVQNVALVSLVATVVESLPISEVIDDNISVPIATMAVASFTFYA